MHTGHKMTTKAFEAQPRTLSGRPPEMLSSQAGQSYVAGVDIGGTHLRMMLSDLDGNRVAHSKVTLVPDRKEPNSVCRLIHDGLLTMCSSAATTKQRVLHMTIGAPGITDVDRGVVISAPNLTHWTEVPLRDLIELETGVPVLIENDTNLAAVGEHSQGAARDIDDFVFIAIGTGVGAGIVLGGKLHHGCAWSAGEIGYLGIPGLPREPLQIDRTGQLERVIGGAGIERRWVEQLLRAGRNDESLNSLRSTQILDLARQEDPDAIAALNDTAGILADAIATITLLLNPTLVVLGGGVGSHQCLRQAMESLLSGSDFPYPAIRTSLLGADAQLHGAISLSLSATQSKLIC